MKPIPYGRQNINEADVRAVVDVLRSDFLTQGPQIERFENAVAQSCGARYAVAVCNATAALHIACLAAGLGPGDWLWTSPNTFVASANCGLYCGAQVDFVDIDACTYNMSVAALEAKLERAASLGQLPKIVVPVHFAGQSCEMQKIGALAVKYGFTVLEDASHAIGGTYQNARVGSCQFSSMAIFSFHPVKIIATGEGGMVTTNDEELWKKLTRLRTHGITRDPAQMHNEAEGAWCYEQIELGFNYRMTDMQAALGTSQMERLDEFVERRHAIAARYNELLSDLPLVLPFQHSNGHSGLHLYVVRLKLDKIKTSRRQVFDALRASGIGVNVHYIPVHTQPYYRQMGFGNGDFPEAEHYYSEAISLPMYFSLSDADQERVVEALRAVL